MRIPFGESPTETQRGTLQAALECARKFGTRRKGEESNPEGRQGREEEEADWSCQEAIRLQPTICERGEEWSQARPQLQRWKVRLRTA
eukprot:Skav209831  [mRNA]  locus=scaffold2703:136375:144328:- [translate_table: standard]